MISRRARRIVLRLFGISQDQYVNSGFLPFVSRNLDRIIQVLLVSAAKYDRMRVKKIINALNALIIPQRRVNKITDKKYRNITMQ